MSLSTTFVNLAIRALRWEYLARAAGADHVRERVSCHGGRVCRERGALPARAGEVIRPYFFLARQAPPEAGGAVTATGAFATIILERLLDAVTVLVLLASFVFVFGTDLTAANPTGFAP